MTNSSNEIHTNEVEKSKKRYLNSEPVNKEYEEILENLHISIELNKKYVIDPSIVGIKETLYIIEKLLEEGVTFVLTTGSIRRLEKLKESKSFSVKFDSRRILSMAATNRESFELVFVGEDFENEKEEILKYCYDNREQVILISSNSGLTTEVRSFGVQDIYLKKHVYTNSKIKTLYSAVKMGDEMVIPNEIFLDKSRSIAVFIDDEKYTSGDVPLKKDAHIYIARREKNYITFTHFVVLSSEEENNVLSICAQKIFDDQAVDEVLYNRRYQEFVREFRNKIFDQF